MRRSGTLALFAASCALVVAACGSDSPAASSSSSTTSTSSPAALTTTTTARAATTTTTAPKTGGRNVTDPSDSVRNGDSGEGVKKIQEALVAAGYKLAVDGKFGNVTETAVKDFQKKNKLTVDGVVGPITWKALEKAANP